MKGQYEDRYRFMLPRRTYTIIRLDGKAFHTYTRGLERPFDVRFMNDMAETATFLCDEIQGAQFAYTQSDEISLLLTDFEKITTDAWFDGNLQKMASVSASLATAKFNQLRSDITERLAFFDARVFVIPDRVEVENYFVWRQKDATRNSLLALTQSLYSHKEMHGKGWSDMHEMCWQKGHNWNDLPPYKKRGMLVRREATVKVVPVRVVNGQEFGGEIITDAFKVRDDTPDFLKEREVLSALVGGYES
jgi:tRNA(His) 5'-end guanylyltransferase